MKQERWGQYRLDIPQILRVAHPCYNEKRRISQQQGFTYLWRRAAISRCNYCIRKLDKCEHRPGVAGSILNPSEALVRVDKYIKEMPNLKVVGIAGPGEALANEELLRPCALCMKNIRSL